MIDSQVYSHLSYLSTFIWYVPKVSDYLCNYSKSCSSLAECNDMDGCSLGENDMSDMTENKYQYNWYWGLGNNNTGTTFPWWS